MWWAVPMRFPAVARVCSLLVAALFALSSLVASGSPATAASSTLVQGADISWPNCPKGEGIPSRRSTGEPMPQSSANFVVVGVTNGPGFHPNPCLANQLRWVTNHKLLLAAYALTTYPSAAQIARFGQSGPYDATTARGALQNASYAEAQYNLSTMSAVDIVVPMLWVDVEPYPVAPWSDDHAANRAVISAVTAAYTAAGYHVGIYTNPNGWPQIVGRAKLPSLPTWSTIGVGREPGARRQCGHGPSGGTDWMVQWWVGDRDLDVLCPAGVQNLSNIFSVPSA